LRVAVHERELDDGVRSRAAQAALVEQRALLFGVDELNDVGVPADLVTRFQARDFGVDVVGASFSCKRDAMVAVLDKYAPPTSKTVMAGMTPSGNAARRFASRLRERRRWGLKSRRKSALRSTEPTMRSIAISWRPRWERRERASLRLTSSNGISCKV
jgi:hypothetical protein